MATEPPLRDLPGSAPPPAPDLFDADPASLAAAEPRQSDRVLAEPVNGARSGISGLRLATRFALLGIAAIAAGLPFWGVASVASAAVAGELLAPWRRLGRVYWTVIFAALCAQATAAFVTPFEWRLRFGFFVAIIGFGVAAYAAQTDDLA